ncbi:MAG: NAD-dependent epimerase/dehydratase family protein [Bacteroidota bacterium]
MSQPRVLIVGKNSFIGNSFEQHSRLKPCDKVSLKTNKLDSINFSDYDTVLHLPAIVHQSSKIPYQQYYEINTELAYKTALKAKQEGVKQFVFLSTIRVYGEYTPKGVGWNEETTPKPTDNYGRSKLEAEEKLRTLNDRDFYVSILRIPMVYGPGNRGNINKMIAFINKYHLAPFLNISNERNILYVKNLVDFIDQVILQYQQGTFLVTDPRPISTTEIAQTISKHLDKKIFLFTVPCFLRGILKFLSPSVYCKIFGNLKLYSTESYKRIGFQPGYSFDQGMKEMIDWYKKNI